MSQSSWDAGVVSTQEGALGAWEAGEDIPMPTLGPASSLTPAEHTTLTLTIGGLCALLGLVILLQVIRVSRAGRALARGDSPLVPPFGLAVPLSAALSHRAKGRP